jgi:predicted nucleic acid-binding protein
MMSMSSVQLALEAALSLPIHLYSDVDLHQLALVLADRFSLPAAYDAHYLALAEWLGGEFWTADQRLVSAVQAALPWVHAAQS